MDRKDIQKKAFTVKNTPDRVFPYSDNALTFVQNLTTDGNMKSSLQQDSIFRSLEKKFQILFETGIFTISSSPSSFLCMFSSMRMCC